MKHRKQIRARIETSTASIKDDKSSSYFPSFIVSLSIIQTLLHIIFLTTDISDSLLVFKYNRRYEVWRYFTLALVHNNVSHLLSNISAQLMYGIQLEKHQGWKKVAVLFFAGTFFGELLAASFESPGECVADSVGASGGVNALIAGYLVFTCLNGKGNRFLQAFAIFSIASEPFILLACTGYAYDTDTCTILRSMVQLEVSIYITHSGGTLVGILMGIPILCKKNSTWYLGIKRVCLFVGSLLFSVCVCFI